MRPDIEERLAEHEALLLEPRERFDQAIVGIVERFHDTFALYSRRKVIAIFAEDFAADAEPDEDPHDTAVE